MRTLSQREQWMTAGFAWVLLAAVYLIILRQPLEQRIGAANEKLGSRARAAPATRPAASVIINLQNQLDQSSRETAAFENRERELAREWTRARDRAGVVRRLASDLAAARMTVLASGPADSDKNITKTSAPAAPPPSAVLLNKTMSGLGCEEPQLWHFSARASYGALLDGLATLGERGNGFVLPISMSLRPSDDGGDADEDPLLIELYLWI
ncbi:MAG: hypothetical protein HY286_01825 [Planctomycetes bacterium]|nr:hypothetical protein [Planctomycetota bacterium]